MVNKQIILFMDINYTKFWLLSSIILKKFNFLSKLYVTHCFLTKIIITTACHIALSKYVKKKYLKINPSLEMKLKRGDIYINVFLVSINTSITAIARSISNIISIC